MLWSLSRTRVCFHCEPIFEKLKNIEFTFNEMCDLSRFRLSLLREFTAFLLWATGLKHSVEILKWWCIVDTWMNINSRECWTCTRFKVYQAGTRNKGTGDRLWSTTTVCKVCLQEINLKDIYSILLERASLMVHPPPIHTLLHSFYLLHNVPSLSTPYSLFQYIVVNPNRPLLAILQQLLKLA